MPGPTSKQPVKVDLAQLRRHGLERQFGDLAKFGFPATLPPGTHTAMVTFIGAIAAADGDLSPRERQFLFGRAVGFGTPEDELQQILKFDYAGADVAQLAQVVPPPARRQALLDAVMTARVDGFAERERDAAIRAAQKVGLDAEFVNAAEAHLQVEDAVRRNRIQVVLGRKPTEAQLALQVPTRFDRESLNWHALWWEFGDLGAMGWPTPPPKGSHALMAKTILAVAAADGAVSEREVKFFLGRCVQFGIPPAELEEVLRFDFTQAPVEELMRSVPATAWRTILYDSILVARSDGFADKERAEAARIAKRLGLGPEVVTAIEAHLDVEDGLYRARTRLALPPPR